MRSSVVLRPAISWWPCVVSPSVCPADPVPSKTQIPENQTAHYAARHCARSAAFWSCPPLLPAQIWPAALSTLSQRLRLHADTQSTPQNHPHNESSGSVLVVEVAPLAQTTGLARSADRYLPAQAKSP